MSSSDRLAVYFAVATLPFVVLLYLSSHLELERYQATRIPDTDAETHVPSADYLRALSLNHRTPAVDLLWIDKILYASQQRKQRQARPAVTDYADAIIELDPHFAPVYIWHDAFRFSNNVNPDARDLEEANRILATGLEYFPDHWQLAQAVAINYHGADHRLERTDQQRIDDLESAVEYAERGAEIEGAPDELTGMALNFRRQLRDLRRKRAEEGEELETRASATRDEVEFLFRRYLAADTDSQRQRIRRHLLALGAQEDFVDRMTDYREDFRSAHHRQASHLPSDLYSLVDTNLYVWHDSDELLSSVPDRAPDD